MGVNKNCHIVQVGASHLESSIPACCWTPGFTITNDVLECMAASSMSQFYPSIFHHGVRGREIPALAEMVGRDNHARLK